MSKNIYQETRDNEPKMSNLEIFLATMLIMSFVMFIGWNGSTLADLFGRIHI